jgi:hypothetical protein
MVEHRYKLLNKFAKEKENLEDGDKINIKIGLTETGCECVHRRIDLLQNEMR